MTEKTKKRVWWIGFIMVTTVTVLLLWLISFSVLFNVDPLYRDSITQRITIFAMGALAADLQFFLFLRNVLFGQKTLSSFTLSISRIQVLLSCTIVLLSLFIFFGDTTQLLVSSKNIPSLVHLYLQVSLLINIVLLLYWLYRKFT